MPQQGLLPSADNSNLVVGAFKKTAKQKDDIYKSKDEPTIVDSALIKSGDLPPDKIRKLIESGRVDVSPEYRRLIERYFGELSEE